MALTSIVVAGKTITITFWTMNLKPVFTKYFNNLIKNYEESHPNIKINWQDVNWQVEQQKILASVAAGNPPDVVNLNQTWTTGFAEKGVLVPFNNLLPKSVLNSYFPSLLETTELNGKYYGLPMYTEPAVLFYNKDILKKAGLKEPPKTWDQLLYDAIIIKNKTGKYAFFPSSDVFALFSTYNLPLVSPNGKKALFNGERYVYVMKNMVYLYQHGYFPRTMVNPGYWNKKTELYQSGQLAMMENAVNFIANVKNNSPSIYKITGVSELPLGIYQQTGAPYVFNLSIVKGSKHPKEAAEFAAYVTNAENEVAFDKIVPVYPTRIAALKDPYFTQSTPNDPESVAKVMGAHELLYTVFQPQIVLPDQQELINYLDNAYIAALMGTKTVKQALDYAAKKWDEALAKKPARYIGGKPPLQDWGLSLYPCGYKPSK